MSTFSRFFSIIALLLCLTSPSLAADSGKLAAAWADKGAARSVFFIEGMTCRACTMLLDRKLNTAKGVYWARFNFPLRLLTVYHDPKTYPTANVEKLMDGSSELRALHLASAPAASFKPGKSTPLASWKGGKVEGSGAGRILDPFREYLAKEMGESDEKTQVFYEILGEAVRTRILAALAAKEGFRGETRLEELPRPIIKDFYWFKEIAAPSREDRAIAEFLGKKVLTGTPDAEMKLFDGFLSDLWKKSALDFRGEFLEIPPPRP